MSYCSCKSRSFGVTFLWRPFKSMVLQKKFCQNKSWHPIFWGWDFHNAVFFFPVFLFWLLPTYGEELQVLNSAHGLVWFLCGICHLALDSALALLAMAKSLGWMSLWFQILFFSGLAFRSGEEIYVDLFIHPLFEEKNTDSYADDFFLVIVWLNQQLFSAG